MVKLYTHRCFARYPHFQLENIDQEKHDRHSFSNNSTTYKGKGKGKGRGRHYQQVPQHRHPKGQGSRGYEKGTRSSYTQNSTVIQPTTKGSTPNKGKGKGKGKQGQQGRRLPKARETCSYCGIHNHNSRECRKRLKEMEEKPITNNSQNIDLNTRPTVELVDDETVVMFTQNVTTLDHGATPVGANEHEHFYQQLQTRFSETSLNVLKILHNVPSSDDLWLDWRTETDEDN
jgi:hypothetical protein